MRASVVFESEFGATRLIAEAIARGLSGRLGAMLVNVRDADPFLVPDMLVLGAPTHQRSMPTERTRATGVTHPRGTPEPDAAAPGMREWLATTSLGRAPVLAFTTRLNTARILSGSATTAIEHAAAAAGGRIAGDSAEFLVTATGSLVDGELGRAVVWGRDIATRFSALPTA